MHHKWRSLVSWQQAAAIAIIAAIVGVLVTQQPLTNPQVAGTTTDTRTLDLPQPSDIPVRVGEPAPQLTAESILVVDASSAAVLYQKAPETQRYPASTTKIMTALVALDEYQLDEVVTITNANESIGHRAEINPGEQLTVESLLYALMLSSGNDAAVALAQHHPEGYAGFVERMNQKAQGFNLNNTNFINVSGIEDPLHYMSARDLVTLTKEAIKNPIFNQLVSTKTKIITSVDGRYTHTFHNLNELLETVPGVKGVKTGWTQQAGECLVTVTQRNERTIITVVMGSQDRMGESEQLIEWAFANHSWLGYQEFIDQVDQ